MLERLVHSSGDLTLGTLLRFSEGACEQGLAALKQGAPILTDTAMAAAAVAPGRSYHRVARGPRRKSTHKTY